MRILRHSGIALLIALLPALYPRLTHPLPRSTSLDFNVYYTAAVLARMHRGALIYDGADTGVDPQLRVARIDSDFAKTARSVGAQNTQLYVYPPTLADLLIPLTFAPLHTAERLWMLFNALAVMVIVALIINLINIPFISWRSLILLIGITVSQPAQACLAWGQITIFLLLLWVGGIFLYRNGWGRSSAVLFSLAAATKLTPILVVIPFLVWKDWRWIRSFAGSLAVIFLAVCLINSPVVIADYFGNVLPSMSRGIPDPWNFTIMSSFQLFYGALHGFPITDGGMVGEMPRWIGLGTKLSALVILFLPIWTVVRFGSSLQLQHRVLVLALLAPLSAAVAPVSWMHAYTVSLLALALVWSDALRRHCSRLRLMFLVACTVALTSSAVPNLLLILHHQVKRQDLFISLLALIVPCMAISLTYVYFATLSELRLEPNSVSARKAQLRVNA